MGPISWAIDQKTIDLSCVANESLKPIITRRPKLQFIIMDHKLLRKYELVSTLFSTIVPPFPIVRVYGVLPLTRNFNFTPSSLLAAREAFHLMSPLVFPWPRPKKGELLAANGSGGQLRVKYWHFRLGDRDSSSLKSSSELKA